MTERAAHTGAAGAGTPRRRLLSRIPLWVRISGIVALILAGVFASSVLLGAFGAGEGQGGGHGGGGQMPMTTHQGGPGSSHGSGGSHDSRPGQNSGGSHGSGGGR